MFTVTHRFPLCGGDCSGPKPGLILTCYSGFCIFIADAILNMVNNIAVNVLGGGQEMQGMTSTMSAQKL